MYARKKAQQQPPQCISRHSDMMWRYHINLTLRAAHRVNSILCAAREAARCTAHVQQCLFEEEHVRLQHHAAKLVAHIHDLNR